MPDRSSWWPLEVKRASNWVWSSMGALHKSDSHVQRIKVVPSLSDSWQPKDSHVESTLKSFLGMKIEKWHYFQWGKNIIKVQKCETSKYNLVDSLAQNCQNWFSVIWERTLPRASLIVIVFGECTTRWEFFFCYYVR